jgi:hypothetical protein
MTMEILERTTEEWLPCFVNIIAFGSNKSYLAMVFGCRMDVRLFVRMQLAQVAVQPEPGVAGRCTEYVSSCHGSLACSESDRSMRPALSQRQCLGQSMTGVFTRRAPQDSISACCWLRVCRPVDEKPSAAGLACGFP